MAILESRHRANEKYNKKAYDSLLLRIPKGMKEEIKQHADSVGESVNAFIKRAIHNDIDECMFAGWLISFFTSDDGASVSANYNEAAGSAKAFNIMARDEALAESYVDYCKLDINENADENAEENTEKIDSNVSDDITESEENCRNRNRDIWCV